MRKNGIKDFKWIFYRQNLRKLVKIGFLALVGFFFQKKWGTNKIKSVSTYPWNVKWILLFSNFDFHILSPPPTSISLVGCEFDCRTPSPRMLRCHGEDFIPQTKECSSNKGMFLKQRNIPQTKGRGNKKLARMGGRHLFFLPSNSIPHQRFIP